VAIIFTHDSKRSIYAIARIVLSPARPSVCPRDGATVW